MDTSKLKDLLERYAEAKHFIADAEASIKELQPQIKDLLADEIGVEYEINGAGITLHQGKPRWKYSDDTTQLEKEVKEKKKLEEQTGIAVETRGEPYLVCRFKTE